LSVSLCVFSPPSSAIACGLPAASVCSIQVMHGCMSTLLSAVAKCSVGNLMDASPSGPSTTQANRSHQLSGPHNVAPLIDMTFKIAGRAGVYMIGTSRWIRLCRIHPLTREGTVCLSPCQI
jgi:hypothetical protein